MMRRYFVMVFMALLMAVPVSAQRHFLSPVTNLGISFNADTNHPLFTGSLRAFMEIGKPSDFLNLSFGAGYRGFFDRTPPHEFVRNASVSDYLLYSSDYGESNEVRPVGGQVVVPVEASLRIVPLGDDVFLTVGCGAEYGVRLYQSQRYARYYGDHMLNPSSFSIYPMLGIEGDVDEISLSLALYWRHYTNSPLNYENLWDPQKFDAKNFFGIQLAVGFEL